ncbi:hypothetical protein DAI22_05g218100 [Oryza sativa Japonica Group]|nr:hypothetical protein DAI22_05g218100 [Oryza sativa Japonica Group]
MRTRDHNRCENGPDLPERKVHRSMLQPSTPHVHRCHWSIHLACAIFAVLSVGAKK